MSRLKADWTHHHATINGIRMHYVEQAAVEQAAAPGGQPVVFCHGFPMLWFSWHRQIPVLAEAGYRIIAPSMRGMGQTEAPEDPAAYGVDEITADLLGLLEQAFPGIAKHVDEFADDHRIQRVDIYGFRAVGDQSI